MLAALELPWLRDAGVHAADIGAPVATRGVRDATALASLAEFQSSNLVKRQMYHALAFVSGGSTAAVRRLRQLFLEADVDASGTLDRAEFESVVRRLDGSPSDRSEGGTADGGAVGDLAATLDLDALFATMDVHAAGAIEWRWFLASMLRANVTRASSGEGGLRSPRTPRTAQRGARGGEEYPALAAAFVQLDRDGDGVVDASDLRQLFLASTGATRTYMHARICASCSSPPQVPRAHICTPAARMHASLLPLFLALCGYSRMRAYGLPGAAHTDSGGGGLAGATRPDGLGDCTRRLPIRSAPPGRPPVERLTCGGEEQLAHICACLPSSG